MEALYPIFFSCLMGIPTGGGISYAICSLKGKAKEVFLLGSGGSLLAVVTTQSLKIVELEVTLPVLAFTFTSIVSASVFIYNYVSDLKSKCPNLPFNISYLISSDSSLSNIYEQYIKSESEGIARKKELDDQSAEISAREEALVKLTKQVDEQKSFQLRMEETLKTRVKDGFTLSLPKSKDIPLSEEMVRALPRYFEHILQFLDEVGAQLELCSTGFESTTKYPEEVLIRASLEVIARAIRTHLIQDTSARVTFRVFDGCNFKAITVDSRRGAAKSVSDIPYNSNNMILASAQAKRGLVKSINPEFDYNLNGVGAKWDDYYTCTFEQYLHGAIPLIALNISIQDSSVELSNFLKFMSYIKFEILIEDLIDMIEDNYSLKKYLLSLIPEAA